MLRRLIPALALLAVAAATLPARALPGGDAGGGAVDADIYLAEVALPGGSAFVEVVSFRYRGAYAHADTSPGASPEVGEETFACVRVERGRSFDETCGDLTASVASGATDLSSGRLRFTLPSRRGHSIAVDLTLTATGELEPWPNYDLTLMGPVVHASGSLYAAVGRVAGATGSVTSTRAGGGRVVSTDFAILAREYWTGGEAFAG